MQNRDRILRSIFFLDFCENHIALRIFPVFNGKFLPTKDVFYFFIHRLLICKIWKHDSKICFQSPARVSWS